MREFGSVIFRINDRKSGAFLNDGSGHFRFIPFPRSAQLAPARDRVFTQTKGDNIPDLVIAQNDYSHQPETGRFDGGLSLVLKGRGDGQFEVLPAKLSGLIVPAAASRVALSGWNRDGWMDIYVAINHGPLQSFQLR